MREYEIILVTRSDIPEAEHKKLTDRWDGILTEDGGEFIHRDIWGNRKLAYPINKQTRGHYSLYNVATQQPNVKELDRVLRLDENVLRFMIIKLSDKVDIAARKEELEKKAQEPKKTERPKNFG